MDAIQLLYAFLALAAGFVFGTAYGIDIALKKNTKDDR